MLRCQVIGWKSIETHDTMPAMHRSLVLVLATACGSKDPATTATGSGSAPVAASGAVAKPAPTWCDGNKCPCKEGDEKATETSKMCELGAPLVVQGVPCGKGRLEFHPDGKLRACDLASPVTVGSYACRVGVGILRLLPDGSLQRCNVSGEYTIGGYQLGRASNAFDLELFDARTLREGELSRPTQVAGHRCKGKLGLYRDGKLYSCDSDEPIVVDDALTLPMGTPVTFAADGSLSGFFPQAEVTYHGEVKKPGYPVCIVEGCNTWPE